jgi:hypothetical protein
MASPCSETGRRARGVADARGVSAPGATGAVDAASVVDEAGAGAAGGGRAGAHAPAANHRANAAIPIRVRHPEGMRARLTLQSAGATASMVMTNWEE